MITQAFRNIWEALNSGTNLLAVTLILCGLAAVLRGHDAAGGMVITGGFTLLNNSKKNEQSQAPDTKGPNA